MRKYFIAKNEAERDATLERIKALGYTWVSGRPITLPDDNRSLNIGFDSSEHGLTTSWDEAFGKRTTIERFLIGLEIEKLKQKKRALPKLREE